MARLQGKVAVVTGGARGMGEATSRLFVQEGAKVVIADILDQEGEKLAGELNGNAIFVHHDVTDENSWNRVIERAQSEFGPIDVLINNAGIVMFKSIADTDKKDYERVLGINLVGAEMVKHGRGSIVNISSVDGLKGCNGLVAYASSKWGVRGLTQVAAMELGHQGVRVNSVHPGGVNTVMGNPANLPREQVDKDYTSVPLQRIGDPIDVARASLFLASDDAAYITGEEIKVDGGMVIGRYYTQLPGAPASLSE
jgi:3alpha(or 20beta)-hydroxysteroid dehydrogenase